MKLVIVIFIIIVVYLIGIQIKIVHVDSLSPENRKEIEERARVRSLLMENHIKKTK